MTDKPLPAQIYSAIAHGDDARVIALLEAHPEQCNPECWPPGGPWLHVAATHGRIEVIAYLHEHGVPLDYVDEDRETAIDCAASKGHAKLVQWLIDHGVSVRGSAGGQALVSAANKGSLETVAVLLDAGADIDAVNPGRPPRNALYQAEYVGHAEVAAYLRSRGATSFCGRLTDEQRHARLLDHAATHFGPVQELALQHIVPAGPVDIALHVSKSRGRRTLFTTGMSDREMTVPEGGEDFRLAELVMHLPSKWTLGPETLEDPALRWPLEWMMKLALYPHLHDTWLCGTYAVIANGEPPEPLGPGTELSCWLLLTRDGYEGATYLESDRSVCWYTMFPLYTDERDLELRDGVEALLQRFQRARISDILRPDRKNVAR